MALPTPVVLDWGPTPPGQGLLGVARPLPAGWERGISFADASCIPASATGICPVPGFTGSLPQYAWSGLNELRYLCAPAPARWEQGVEYSDRGDDEIGDLVELSSGEILECITSGISNNYDGDPEVEPIPDDNDGSVGTRWVERRDGTAEWVRVNDHAGSGESISVTLPGRGSVEFSCADLPIDQNSADQKFLERARAAWGADCVSEAWYQDPGSGPTIGFRLGGSCAQELPLPVDQQPQADEHTQLDGDPGTPGDTLELKPLGRPLEAVFTPVTLIMSVACTGAGRQAVDGLAGAELDLARDLVLARELFTGETSARDTPRQDNTPQGNPYLVGMATALGEYESVAQAVGCLEEALLRANGGRGGVLFASLVWQAWLRDAGLVWRDGARWRSPSGLLVVVSPAFDGREPRTEQPPAPGDNTWLYAAGNVWAGVGERWQLDSFDRAVNTIESRAEDIGLVVFPPCAVFAASSSQVVAC